MPKDCVSYQLGGVNSRADYSQVKTELSRIPGVLTVALNAENARLTVDFDNTGTNQEKILETLHDLGYLARPSKPGSDSTQEGEKPWPRRE